MDIGCALKYSLLNLPLSLPFSSASYSDKINYEIEII